jgi:hypothetical protein
LDAPRILNLQQLPYSLPTDPPPSFPPRSPCSQQRILHGAASSFIPASLLHLRTLLSPCRTVISIPCWQPPSLESSFEQLPLITGSPLLSSTPNRGPLHGAHPRRCLLRHQLTILSSFVDIAVTTHYRRFLSPLTTCQANNRLTRMRIGERIRGNAW